MLDTMEFSFGESMDVPTVVNRTRVKRNMNDVKLKKEYANYKEGK